MKSIFCFLFSIVISLHGQNIMRFIAGITSFWRSHFDHVFLIIVFPLEFENERSKHSFIYSVFLCTDWCIFSSWSLDWHDYYGYIRISVSFYSYVAMFKQPTSHICLHILDFESEEKVSDVLRDLGDKYKVNCWDWTN